MSTTPQKGSNDQEIDLSQISKRLSQVFEDFLSWIFRGILFIQRNIIKIGLLLIISFGLGIYLDRSSKSYEHQIIVTPNFDSVEYLYSKISLLNSKIKEKDTLFLKTIGIENPKNISIIEVEPVVEVYDFVNRGASSNLKTQNFQMLELLSESGDINKIIEEDITSRNYSNHIIKIKTAKPINTKSTISPILNYLNSNAFFQEIQKTYSKNTEFKIVKNEEIINQINEILKRFSTESSTNSKNDKLIYNNENSQLSELISIKNDLIEDIANKRLNLINNDKIIKDKSNVTNVEVKKGLNGKMKFIIPLIMISFLIIFRMLSLFYKRQLLRHNA